MKKVVSNSKNNKDLEVIAYIVTEYEKDYRKKFLLNEFKNDLDLKEVIQELNELGYVTISKSKIGKHNG